MTEIISPKMATSRNGLPIPPFGAATNIGLIREQNEDSLIAMPPLFAVCDGMGGHEAGEVASGIAAKTLFDEAPAHADGKALGRAVIAANRAVIAGAEQERGRPGMGTTCTATLLEGDHLVVAQVGDSRAYLLHGGSLQQITRDHSLVADLVDAGRITEDEARVHPQRSIITRALGNDPDMVPDIYDLAVEVDDRLILCSDGLYGMVLDPAIEKIAKETSSASECVDNLIEAALAAGGVDNVTVIVVDIPLPDGKKEIEKSADTTPRIDTKRRRRRIIGFIIAFILVIGGVVGGTYAYAQHSDYFFDIFG
jgi:serine/threonine protein phosphatase PrpC